jgi:8-oxo-dGTP diphosphatase
VARPLFDFLPRGSVAILREIVRVALRRPVAGVAAVARRADGQLLLVKRGDTGQWALPGGTLEWGEPLRACIVRELREEAGATVERLGRLVGVYGAPDRDPRMHGVTVLVEAVVAERLEGPLNALEIHGAGFFPLHALPGPLAFGMDDMLCASIAGGTEWE